MCIAPNLLFLQQKYYVKAILVSTFYVTLGHASSVMLSTRFYVLKSDPKVQKQHFFVSIAFLYRF